ncbi:hypothetical protein HAX54_018752 [Datura stramonium]|uniref:Uncharacterized protein n=1 Tax=Datura stramonium TaxID=4076 RepID=A0ABS8S1F0_DATST|nr:hypothetical protein [Datura stramonium]
MASLADVNAVLSQVLITEAVENIVMELFGRNWLGFERAKILTGRKNNRGKNTEYSDSLISSAWQHFQHAKVEELFDPNLMLHNYHTSNKMEVLCIHEVLELRPSVSMALQMLVKKEEELPAQLILPLQMRNRWSFMTLGIPHLIPIEKVIRLQLPAFLTVFSTPDDVSVASN